MKNKKTEQLIKALFFLIVNIVVTGLVVMTFLVGYGIKEPKKVDRIIEMYVPQDNEIKTVKEVSATYGGEDIITVSLRGSLYEKNENITIYAGVYNSTNKVVNSSCKLSIYYPNTTIWVNNNDMTQFEIGKHNYSAVAPSNVYGTYFISVNCTRLSDNAWAMTDGELQIEIGLMQRIRSLFTKDFSVASLAAVSPIYANENVKVEATFSYFDGNVTPDAINLTIYNSSGALWDSATKTDFTKNDVNVWSYSQSVGSSPTTGRYSVQLMATYNNDLATKVTQFRIATGGPYAFTISGSSTICLGDTYTVTNTATNEGEGDTETNVYNWIDIDGDGILDSDEPQASFSREVAGYATFTQSTSITIPSTTAIGSYVVRGKAVFVNSQQPDATSSYSANSINCKEASIGTPVYGGPTILTIEKPTVPPIPTTISELKAQNYFWLYVLLALLALLFIIVSIQQGYFQAFLAYIIGFGYWNIAIIIAIIIAYLWLKYIKM